jgi:peptidoglycan/LPS O-acetylase OafA/YrhL
MKKMLSYFVAFVVLFPTTLVAAPLSVVGLLVACNGIVDPNISSPLALFSAIMIGDFGLASMWILFFHYREKSTKPPRSWWHYCALLGGAAVSLTLVISTDETVFFGWPLIGAVFFLGLLTTSRNAGLEEFRIPPERLSSG